MSDQGKKLLLCNCLHSMKLDGAAISSACGLDTAPEIHSHLCRAQIQNAREAAAPGNPVVVACTQEAPLFGEIFQEVGTPVTFTNIREHAGWSEDGNSTTPKIAALLAEARLDIPPARTVAMESAGHCLVYGCNESALACARQLSGRLAVHTLLTGTDDILPPPAMNIPVFRGTVSRASGHLGAFEVTIDRYAPYNVDSRHELEFGPGQDGVDITFDIIVDLTGGDPLFPAPDKRDGYFHPDPGNPASVQRALFDAADLVGTFEKPLYINYRGDLCAHSRSSLTGCTRCLDVCPASAITPDGDVVAIDPHICGGCGACAGVCPTGAAGYEMPSAEGLLRRLRTLLHTYQRAGGARPVILIHDDRKGTELIHMSARFGRGLPANVIPFPVNETTQIGLDILAGALAYGAEQVLIQVPPERRRETDGLSAQIAIANAVLEELSFGGPRARMLEIDDPANLDTELRALTALDPVPQASFLPVGSKRDLFRLTFGHLHRVAPAPVDIIPLPAQAPFGTIDVDIERCTLCLACVGSCPTGALQDSPDAPMLRFQEDACVQCGLCKTTCPENVITLRPRLNFTEEARQALVLKEEEPFHCIRCGKPFGTKSTIERVVKQLADRHPMFKEGAMVDRIRMCDDCRVIDQMGESPFAFGTPRRTRTTDDYLREEAEEAGGDPGNGQNTD